MKPHDSTSFKARLTLKLQAQDALALIERKGKSVIAKWLLNLDGIERLWLRLFTTLAGEDWEAAAFISPVTFLRFATHTS